MKALSDLVKIMLEIKTQRLEQLSLEQFNEKLEAITEILPAARLEVADQIAQLDSDVKSAHDC